MQLEIIKEDKEEGLEQEEEDFLEWEEDHMVEEVFLLLDCLEMLLDIDYLDYWEKMEEFWDALYLEIDLEDQEELLLQKCRILEMLGKLYKNGEEELSVKTLYLWPLKEILDIEIIIQDIIDMEIDNSIIMEDIIQDTKDQIGLEEIEEEVEEELFKKRKIKMN